LRQLIVTLLTIAVVLAVLPGSVLGKPELFLAVATIDGPSVAILVSNYTRTLARMNSLDFESDVVDATAVIRVLGEIGIEAVVIGDHDIEAGGLARYEVLIMPAASAVSDLEIEKIREFARSGGKILSTYDTSLYDSFWRVRAEYGLSAIMGVGYQAPPHSNREPMRPTNPPHRIFRGIGPEIILPRGHTAQSHVATEATVLARWASGAPAIVESNYGVYCAGNLFARANLSSSAVANLVRNIVAYLIDRETKSAKFTSRIAARVAWYRPAGTPEDIRAEFDRMERAGFNTVFVETFYHGYTIYPSEVATQRPQFLGFDPLRVALQEGRRRGIKVHAWLELFYVGPGVGDGIPGPILERHPDWAAVGLDGKQPVAAESNKYFLSPAHPEVQAFLLTLVDELVSTYKVDGVHFDYLRYPFSRPVPYDYNPVVTKMAAADLGFEPREVRLDISRWNAWFLWRCNNLTQFVGRLAEVIRARSPESTISAGVYPYQDALLTRMQDWKAWGELGYIDFAVVFTYTLDNDLLDTLVRAAQYASADRIAVYPAVDAASMPRPLTEKLLDLLEAIRKTGSRGAAVFTLNALPDETLDALAAGPFKLPSSESRAR
jgi:uncharacterized lipoprotein YddW (UPF0748 family)